LPNGAFRASSDGERGLRGQQQAKERQVPVSKRIDKSWTVFESVENRDHDRCVDFFARPDGTYGFEEFRRDVEDNGAWTPVEYFSSAVYPSRAAAAAAASEAVAWLTLG
jgi:hypothetical protein